MSTQWPPSWVNALVAWIKNPATYLYGRWNAPSNAAEGGVDLGSPGGTPVYALASGPIVGAGNFWHSSSIYTPGSGPPGYGVVTTRVNVPGYGLQDLYYQHIQLAPGIHTCYAGNCNGQTVTKGQLLGWVTPGVNEVETGFNANWGGVWGTNHPGSWATDPRPMLKALIGAGPGADTPGSLGTGVNPFDPTSWLNGIVAPLEQGVTTFVEVAMLVIIALVLAYFGFKIVTGQGIGSMTEGARKSAGTIAKVAAL